MLSYQMRKDIKSLILSMEESPAQIDIYLRQLRSGPNGQESVDYAWDIISKSFEDENILELENQGIVPNNKKQNKKGYPEDEDPFAEGNPEEEPDEDESDGEDDEENDEDEDSDEEDEDSEDDEDSDEDDDDESSDDDEDDDENDDEDGNDDEDEGDSDEEGDESEENDEDSDGDDDIDPASDEDSDEENKEVGADSSDEDKGGEGAADGDSYTDDPLPQTEEIQPSPAMNVGKVKIPSAERHVETSPVSYSTELPETSLKGLSRLNEQDVERIKQILPEAQEVFQAGHVYLVPADTGKEVELRVLEIRAATNENLRTARKIQEALAESVAEERQIRDSMFATMQRYQTLTEQMADLSLKASEIQQRLLEGTARGEQFLNADMARLLQQRAKEATDDFYQEARDNYNDLFKSAVRRYKQFTEAAMDFQDKMTDENGRRVRALESKLDATKKICYALFGAQFVMIVLLVIFKVIK